MLTKASSNTVEIKGYGNDVNIILDDEADFSDVELKLVKRLEDSDQFFSGHEIVLDVGDRVLSAEECGKLKSILSDRFNLIVSAVRSQSEETRKAAEKIGWKAEPPKKKEETKEEKIRKVAERESDTILFKGTLRSGQRVYHRGNVVIVGDVNPGAEVIAAGDVVVMGALRGVAHAGAEGDTEAEVIALDLRPIQLRIAGYIGRSPDLKLEMDKVPEVARVEDGNIIVHRLK